MKKITLTTLIVIGTMVMAFGQIPNDHRFRFDFQNKSLINYSFNDAANLSTREGSVITELEDRFGDPKGAIDISVAPYTGLADPLATSGTSAQTMSFWVKKSQMDLNTSDEVAAIWRNRNRDIGFWIRFRRLSTGFELTHMMRYDIGTDVLDASATNELDDDEWHNIIYQVDYEPTEDTAYFSFYIDGVQDTALDAKLRVGKNWVMLAGTDPIFRLGTRMGIDDVRYYERSLTAAERAQLYNEKPIAQIYVDADAVGNNDGTSWANAFNAAEDAFKYCYSKSEIWVAEGTYVRTRADFNTNYAFIWEQDSIKVYGGFDGSETSLSQRDWDAHPTIFSGEYDNDGIKTNNAQAVFVGPFVPGTFGYVDGIKITDGYAKGEGTQFGGSGSGLFLSDFGDAHFKNIEIYGNYATTGPAVGIVTYSTDRTFVLENMNIHDNTSTNASAFVLRNRPGGTGSNTKVTWINSLVYNNHTTGQNTFHGSIGALLQNQGTVQNDFINCTFANNTTDNPSTSGEGNILSTGTNLKLNMYNCIMSGNGNVSDLRPNQTNIPTTATISNCILDDTQLPASWTLTNNQDVSPQFADSANNDFTLAAGSPAINAGTLTIPGFSFPNTDFAGNPRNTSKSIDIGCYEFQGNASVKRQARRAINVYPNPAHNLLTIEQDADKYVSTHILDLSGKTLYTYEGNQSSIDISSLPSGVYILHLEGVSSHGFARFVKN